MSRSFACPSCACVFNLRACVFWRAIVSSLISELVNNVATQVRDAGFLSHVKFPGSQLVEKLSACFLRYLEIWNRLDIILEVS